MKTAIIGSRTLDDIIIDNYIPKDTSMIISGGAKGIDKIAEKYAKKHCIATLIFLPDYQRYGKSAPLIRNKQIVENADVIIAFWDGNSNGTRFVIDYAKKQTKLYLFTFFNLSSCRRKGRK